MDYVSTYAEFLKKHAELKRPLKVVCDSSNGTTSIVLQKLQDIPNLKLSFINQNLDPDFSAHGPNPLANNASLQLCQKVLELQADFGAIFDADGDRAFFVDNEGKLLPSFISAAIMFSQNKPPFVTDELVYMSLTSTKMFPEADLVPAQIGSIFIKEAIQKNVASMGAEYSGHFYFKDFFGLDSGIFSLICMANALSGQDATLAKLYNSFPIQYTKMLNLDIKNKSWPALKKTLRERTSLSAKNYFERDGLTFTTENSWTNIRPSNTEPLVRISVGCKTEDQAEKALAYTAKIIG